MDLTTKKGKTAFNDMLGRTIRRQRVDHTDLTVGELAERALIARKRLWRIEAGETACTVEDLCRIAVALGVAPDVMVRTASRCLKEEAIVVPVATEDDDQ